MSLAWKMFVTHQLCAGNKHPADPFLEPGHHQRQLCPDQPGVYVWCGHACQNLDLQKDESVGKTLENLSALISAMVHSQTHEPDNI